MERFAGNSPHLPFSTTDESEVRLVTILPGAPEDPVACELENVSLDSASEYDGLSYAWGDPSDTSDILLNGRPYPVTKNLFAALVSIRSYHLSGRRFWIDALCINQKDKVERSRQVTRMAGIFRSACEVLVWIGGFEDVDEVSIARFFEQGNVFASRVMIESRVGNGSAESIASLRSEMSPELDYVLLNLLRRPWFYRMWIIQEVAYHSFNSFILCENLRIQLAVLWGLYRVFKSDRQGNRAWVFVHDSSIEQLHAVQTWVREKNPVQSKIPDSRAFAKDLLWLLHQARQFEASDPHDNVYALLSLIEAPYLPWNLMPDYTIPAESVFHAYNRFLLEETGDLTILEARALSTSTTPSWVVGMKLRFPSLEQARSPGKVRFSADGLQMQVVGFRWGQIIQKGGRYVVDYVPALEDFVPLERAIRALDRDFVDFIHRLTPSVLRSDILEYMFKEVVDYSEGHNPTDLQRAYNFLNEPTDDHEDDAYVLPSDVIFALCVLLRLSWYVLDTGKIGYTDSARTEVVDIQIGDSVCHFEEEDAKGAFVLREKKGDDDVLRWTYIDCGSVDITAEEADMINTRSSVLKWQEFSIV